MCLGEGNSIASHFTIGSAVEVMHQMRSHSSVWIFRHSDLMDIFDKCSSLTISCGLKT